MYCCAAVECIEAVGSGLRAALFSLYWAVVHALCSAVMGVVFGVLWAVCCWLRAVVHWVVVCKWTGGLSTTAC